MTSTRSHKTKAAADLGALLAAARTKKRLTQHQASDALNIPRRQIAALEEGDFSLFAAELYARGACLKYAGWLGIEAAEIERGMWRALSAGRERVPLKIHTPFALVERLLNARLVLWVAIAAVALAVGAYIIWQIQTFLELPVIVLAEPLPAMAQADRLVVQGTAPAESKVTVNGETVVLQAGGSFAVPILLHGGINIIRIEAQNAAGRTSVITQDVLRPRR